jgi:hypothetical protein
MLSEPLAAVIPVSLLFLAIGFACALSRSKAEDPKFKLLDSLLRAAAGTQSVRDDVLRKANPGPMRAPRPPFGHFFGDLTPPDDKLRF